MKNPDRPCRSIITLCRFLVIVHWKKVADSQDMVHFMPYTFGVDPIWRWSDQLIKFTNSLKMKNAVILGVAQMTFGIVLKILNFIHAGHWSLVLAVATDVVCNMQ